MFWTTPVRGIAPFKSDPYVILFPSGRYEPLRFVCPSSKQLKNYVKKKKKTSYNCYLYTRIRTHTHTHELYRQSTFNIIKHKLTRFHRRERESERETTVWFCVRFEYADRVSLYPPVINIGFYVARCKLNRVRPTTYEQSVRPVSMYTRARARARWWLRKIQPTEDNNAHDKSIASMCVHVSI